MLTPEQVADIQRARQTIIDAVPALVDRMIKDALDPTLDLKDRAGIAFELLWMADRMPETMVELSDEDFLRELTRLAGEVERG